MHNNNNSNDENCLQIVHTSPSLICPNPELLCVRTKMDKDNCCSSNSPCKNA